MFISHFSRSAINKSTLYEKKLFPHNKSECQNLTGAHFDLPNNVKQKEELWAWLIHQGNIKKFPFLGYGITTQDQWANFVAKNFNEKFHDILFKEAFIPLCSFPNTRYSSRKELILLRLCITQEMYEQTKAFKEKAEREAREAQELIERKKQELANKWKIKNDETVRLRNLEERKKQLQRLPEGPRKRSSLKRSHILK